MKDSLQLHLMGFSSKPLCWIQKRVWKGQVVSSAAEQNTTLTHNEVDSYPVYVVPTTTFTSHKTNDWWLTWHEYLSPPMFVLFDCLIVRNSHGIVYTHTYTHICTAQTPRGHGSLSSTKQRYISPWTTELWQHKSHIICDVFVPHLQIGKDDLLGCDVLGCE